MAEKRIITCAVTGNIHTRQQNPNLPVTPVEIARAALDAEKAGAAIIHIHVRDLVSELGSMDIELYREVVGRIRDSGSKVILNLTTGEGGRFIPMDDEPRKAGPGTTLCAPELRVSHIKELKPEICTLDFNTMNNGKNVVINTPRNVKIMAEIIKDSGTRPELEIFDSGDLNMAKDFLESGIIEEPAMFQFVLGTKYGAAANFETLAFLVSQLPRERIWAAFGIGRFAFPVFAMAYLLGGHLRLGMEDTVYVSKGELATSNAQLVEKGVKILESLGGSPASVDEARALLSKK